MNNLNFKVFSVAVLRLYLNLLIDVIRKNFKYFFLSFEAILNKNIYFRGLQLIFINQCLLN